MVIQKNDVLVQKLHAKIYLNLVLFKNGLTAANVDVMVKDARLDLLACNVQEKYMNMKVVRETFSVLSSFIEFFILNLFPSLNECIWP